MGIDALVVGHQTESADETFFTSLFLKSNDFDMLALKKIAQEIGISAPSNVNKIWLVDEISHLSYQTPAVQRVIIRYLLGRKKGWLTFKSGSAQDLPTLADSVELVTKLGEEQWYGPVRESENHDEWWYIRPSFVTHWEMLDNASTPQKSTIRWLCFARISNNTISFHWNGFSYSDSVDRIGNQNVQFPYWQFVPNLFDEILLLTRANIKNVNLHQLILHTIWENYRYDSAYNWIDKKIRAESGGVSLNARAGNVQELSVQGIRGLANTIRRSIQTELFSKYGTNLPEPDTFDEVILRTLLREFGTLSYEFALESEDGEKIFRSHCYFGQKPDFNTPDSFPHLRVFTTWQSDLEVLEFLLRHLGRYDDGDSQPKQAALFG